jgi:hypothetical protein
MSNPDIPQELIESIQNCPDFSEIEQIHAFEFSSDASGAIREGAVLLAVSTVSDDKDGDGFRCLVGLPRGTEVTPYLSSFFHGSH